MTTMLEQVKRTARRNVRRMSDEDVLAWLDKRSKALSARSTISSSEMCRQITGGFWSQSLDDFVGREIAKRYRKIKENA